MDLPTICFYCGDQNPHRDKSRGITNYTLGLLTNLKRGGAVSLAAVTSKSSSGVPEGIPCFRLPFATDRIAGRLLADQLHPLIVPSQTGDAWHYPKGFLPFKVQVRAPKVGTIADTILQFYADEYPRERSRAAYSYWLAMLKNSIRHFDLILTVSEFSKTQILEFAHRYRLNCPPIVVTYQAIEDFDGQSFDGEKENYVLHLASRLPHKKTNWLLREWQLLQEERPELPQLRLIGQLDDGGTTVLAKLRNIELHQEMNRQELAEQIKKARALLLPSEIEGFGLPALEAYELGTPVAYVKETAVEEILGRETPGGFTLASDSLADALDQVLSMTVTAVRTKAAALRQKFSWDQTVALTIAGYRTALENKSLA